MSDEVKTLVTLIDGGQHPDRFEEACALIALRRQLRSTSTCVLPQEGKRIASICWEIAHEMRAELDRRRPAPLGKLLPIDPEVLAQARQQNKAEASSRYEACICGHPKDEHGQAWEDLGARCCSCPGFTPRPRPEGA